MKRREFIAGLAGAVAWPDTVRGQEAPVPLIGYLSAAGENSQQPRRDAFRQGLSELGFVEGRNVEVVYSYADTQYDRLRALAAELVRRRVSVIVAVGSPASPLAAKSETAMIPIVFFLGTDPVDAGLVASLNRPGANVTGVSFLTTLLVAKRLELLHEVAPATTSIGFLLNPTDPTIESQVQEAETAARTLGVRLVILKAGTPSEIEAAFATLVAQRIGSLLTSADAFFGSQGNQLRTLAAHHAVPAIYPTKEYVYRGGLMSYGADFSDGYRVVGSYAGRILKGEKPADLPVQQFTKVKLVINLKVAKALSLEVPSSILVRADEVIE